MAIAAHLIIGLVVAALLHLIERHEVVNCWNNGGWGKFQVLALSAVIVIAWPVVVAVVIVCIFVLAALLIRALQSSPPATP